MCTRTASGVSLQETASAADAVLGPPFSGAAPASLALSPDVRRASRRNAPVRRYMGTPFTPNTSRRAWRLASGPLPVTTGSAGNTGNRGRMSSSSAFQLQVLAIEECAGVGIAAPSDPTIGATTRAYLRA